MTLLDSWESPGALELWGGYECTVNRVGDSWFDQTPRSGHEHRADDLKLFADISVRSLRYPALWERISPNRPDEHDFSWCDERLPMIRELGMNPIVTLCHHGSGPKYTSLIHENFAPGLARHAAAVAERYPWITDWTPVNEPLTTARFSALYGYWYPHTTDESVFWLALLNEIDATRLAMREIRKVNSAARLIQTDDLGYCHATEPLQCEADFQNERRWIGWDLLCGMVVPGHALWDRLAGLGFGERLKVISDDPCPPDVIGVNHYLSSERLLDHRVERHADRSLADRELGTCAGVPFVDVDAVRHYEEGVLGLPALLEQAWRRYGRTIAVTECHNGATRDEQIRWFVEVWRSAQKLRDRGVDLCAVTAWSLLGAYDWNRMVTRFVGHYEPGVFDVRSGIPRPTRLASVLRDLAAGEPPSCPGLGVPGWWRRARGHDDAATCSLFEIDPEAGCRGDHQPLVILGPDGMLADLAVLACEVRGLHYVRAGHALNLDWDGFRPWAVVDVRPANVWASAPLPHGTPWAVFSDMTDGASRHSLPDGVLVVRTAAIYAPWDRTARAVRLLEALDGGRPLEPLAERPWNEVYGPDVMDAVLDLLLDGVSGVANFVPLEGWSETDFVRALADVADCDAGLPPERGSGASSPRASAETWSFMPPGETSLERFVRECRAARREGEFAVQRRADDTRLQAAE